MSLCSALHVCRMCMCGWARVGRLWAGGQAGRQAGGASTSCPSCACATLATTATQLRLLQLLPTQVSVDLETGLATVAVEAGSQLDALTAVEPLAKAVQDLGFDAAPHFAQ